jgi:hypothetical protein
LTRKTLSQRVLFNSTDAGTKMQALFCPFSNFLVSGAACPSTSSDPPALQERCSANLLWLPPCSRLSPPSIRAEGHSVCAPCPSRREGERWKWAETGGLAVSAGSGDGRTLPALSALAATSWQGHPQRNHWMRPVQPQDVLPSSSSRP